MYLQLNFFPVSQECYLNYNLFKGLAFYNTTKPNTCKYFIGQFPFNVGELRTPELCVMRKMIFFEFRDWLVNEKMSTLRGGGGGELSKVSLATGLY